MLQASERSHAINRRKRRRRQKKNSVEPFAVVLTLLLLLTSCSRTDAYRPSSCRIQKPLFLLSGGTDYGSRTDFLGNSRLRGPTFLASTTPPPTTSENSNGDSRLGGATTDSKSVAASSNITFYSPNVPLGDHRPDQQNKDGDSTLLHNHPDASTSVNEYSFFDEAVILVRAGSGGQGASTYKKGVARSQNGPPDGGNGGNGGNVLLQVDPSLNTLAGLTAAWRPNSFGGSGAASADTVRPKSFRAENGSDGERQFKNGRFAKDVVIRVPPGTVVQEQVTERDDEGNESVRWIDLGSLTTTHQGSESDNPGKSNQDELIVAKGGQGGEGSGVQGKNRGVRRPRVASKGGERKTLKLTLKIVADVALVGVPNSGKSTFLASVTRAKPKIANYPFTTVIPNLGVWTPGNEHTLTSLKSAGSDGLVLCDVPGLIAGAAQGVGLGHAFLRHVERCHVILHLVDATSDDPLADYRMLNQEIVKYGTGQLAKMPQVVVVNKVDAFEGAGEDWEEGLRVKWPRDELEAKLKNEMPHSRLMWMSAKQSEGVDELMGRLAAFVKKVKDAQ